MILLAVIAWKRFSPAVRAYIITGCALLLAYICFYARYTVWSGDFAWGDRYVSTTVELVGAARRSAVAAPSRTQVGKAHLDYRNRAARRQRDHPGRVARLLAAARDLPDGDASAIRPS